jgi:hypothetical protein
VSTSSSLRGSVHDPSVRAAAMAKNLSETTGITTPGQGGLAAMIPGPRIKSRRPKKNTMAHRP